MQKRPTGFELRPDWLALRPEPALEPAQIIIDSHHHLYHRPEVRYLLEDYVADLASGHDVRATVAVQARAMLRAAGPPELASLGETEFFGGQAAMSDSGFYGPAHVAAAIVGYVDLTLGDRLRPILEHHLAVSGRLRAIRQPLAWDADAALLNLSYGTPADLAGSPAFCQGMAVLQDLGLSFDIWAYYPQLHQIAQLARAFPKVPMVINHLGGVVRVGAHMTQDVFTIWRQGMAALADCPNVSVKLSGMGMRLSGFGFDDLALPPTSSDLAAAWKPWMMAAVEMFGAQRCMWGSNFPVDKGSYSYAVGLNAAKLLLAQATPSERDDVFWRTASKHYNVKL